MKIGVYVGSFNPPHLGHIKVIKHLLQNHYVDKVIVIPTGNYWDKTNLIETFHRINMLKYYETENIIINSELNELPYTYQILNCLSNQYKGDNLSLIIGDDNLPKFHLWKNYQEILKYQIIVLKRNNIDIKNTIAYNYRHEAFTFIEDFNGINISSTMIRNYLQEGNYSEVRKFIGDDILSYIIDNNLYKVKEHKLIKVKK